MDALTACNDLSCTVTTPIYVVIFPLSQVYGKFYTEPYFELSNSWKNNIGSAHGHWQKVLLPSMYSPLTHYNRLLPFACLGLCRETADVAHNGKSTEQLKCGCILKSPLPVFQRLHTHYFWHGDASANSIPVVSSKSYCGWNQKASYTSYVEYNHITLCFCIFLKYPLLN